MREVNQRQSYLSSHPRAPEESGRVLHRPGPADNLKIEGPQ